MLAKTEIPGWGHLVVAGLIAPACTDAPARVMQPTTPQLDAVKFWEDNATTRWNRRPTEVFGTTTLPGR